MYKKSEFLKHNNSNPPQTVHTYIDTYMHIYTHSMDPQVCHKDNRKLNKS
jgi:hypothetical protein